MDQGHEELKIGGRESLQEVHGDCADIFFRAYGGLEREPGGRFAKGVR